jgi:hypothetical protein
MPTKNLQIAFFIASTQSLRGNMVYFGLVHFAKALAAALAQSGSAIKDALTQAPWDRLARLDPSWTTTHDEPPYLENKLEPGQSACKADVVLDGLKPIMFAAWVEVVDCFATLGKSCIVTSALDGKHSAFSLHYEGLALDFRTRHLTPLERTQLRGMMKRKLDDLARDYNATNPERRVRFDVVLERTHVHCEADEA